MKAVIIISASKYDAKRKGMKPGAKIIITGVIMFVLGAFAAPLAIILSIIFTDSNEVQFKIPGNTLYTIKEPGRYYFYRFYIV